MLNFPGQGLPGHAADSTTGFPTQGAQSGYKVRYQKPASGDAALPPPPLEEEILERIRALLRENGGIVPLGKICHDFLGLKKAQLEGHFILNRVGDQWQVALPELNDGNFHVQAAAAAMASGNPSASSLLGAATGQQVGHPGNAGFGMFTGGLDGLSAGLDTIPPEMQLGSLGNPSQGFNQGFAGAAHGMPQQSWAASRQPGMQAQMQMGFAAGTMPEAAFAGMTGVGFNGTSPGQGADGAAFSNEAAGQQAEVAPLEPAQVEAVAVYLEQHGGALPLGRVTQNFKGLKRAQLETYFELSQVGTHGQWEVRLPGMESQGAEMIFQGKALPMDAPLPPLSVDQISAVTNLLAATPGQSMPFMQVCKHVPGIKRKQLEDHFQVLQIDKKRFDISLNGPPGRVDTRKTVMQIPAGGLEPVVQVLQQPPPPAMMTLGGPVGMDTMLGVAPAPTAPQEPPPPLEPEVVQQVTELLEAFGGETWMGKVSQMFKFIKRSQLEPHFEFKRVGDQWLVRLPGLESAVAGDTAVAQVKQLLGTGSAEQGGAPAMQPPQMMQAGPNLPPLKAPAGYSAMAGGFRGPVGSAQPGMRPVRMRSPAQMQARPPFMAQQPMARPFGAAVTRAAAKEATEPPPPLTEEVVQGIMSLVELAGGIVPMGRVSQAFIGVKRAQLEGHFDLSREGDQWRVAVPAEKRRRVE